MSICKYCGLEITWIEDRSVIKPDGTFGVKPYNVNGSRHNCEQYLWAMAAKREEQDRKYQEQQANIRAKMWCLPVFCPLHGYEPNDNPCQIVLDTGFVPHIQGTDELRWSYPPNWYAKWYSEDRSKRYHAKKKSEDHSKESAMEEFI